MLLDRLSAGHTQRARTKPSGVRPLLGLGVALWLLLVVVWIVWTPYVFLWRGNPVREFSPPGTPQLFPETWALDLLGNLLLLAPLGAAVALSTMRRPVLSALLAGVAVSTVLEVGQIWLPDRTTSVADLVLNAAGAGVGAVVAFALARRWSAGRALLALGSAVYAGVLAYTMFSGYVFDRDQRLEGWEADYSISAGRDSDGDMPYVGRVWGASVCAGTGAERLCAEPGADLERRRQLVALAERTQDVEARAHVLSAADSQTGPTRIVTFSPHAWATNVTLCQWRTTLCIRFRTPLMGPNGENFEIWVPDAIHQGEPVEVSTRFHHGTVRTALVSRARTRVYTHRFDALGSGLLMNGFMIGVMPAEVRAARALALVILCLPIVLLAVAFSTSRRR